MSTPAISQENQPHVGTQYVPDSNDNSSKSKTFSGKRFAISALTIVPHMLKNIGLGALKGLELCACTPVEFLSRKVEGVATMGGKLNKLCKVVAKIVGGAIGVILAAPGVLIGATVGLCRSVYRLPEAMKTSWDDSFGAALKLADNFCTINKQKIAVILSIGAVLLAGGVIGTAASAGAGAALLILTSPILLGGFYTLKTSINALKQTMQGQRIV